MSEKSGHPTAGEKLCWWAEPPKPGQTIDDVVWGYLIFFEDGHAEFENVMPSSEEIEAAKKVFSLINRKL